MKIVQYSQPHSHLPVKTGLHSHPFWQFDWFFNTGEISVELKNKTLNLSPENLIFIPPHIEHNIIVPDNSFTCGIKFDIEEHTFPHNETKIILLEDYKPILDVLFSDNIYDKEIIGHLMQALLLMIKQNEGSIDEQEQLKDERIQCALKFMHKNILATIPRKEIAKHVNMSESHFAKLFREECGFSVMKKVRTMKIEKAAEMLEYSDYNISQISNMLAFSDLQTFSRFFHNEMGISPSSFKKKYSLKNKKKLKKERPQ